jgi:anaerobic selenocysteine-containing dehydrogenase
LLNALVGNCDPPGWDTGLASPFSRLSRDEQLRFEPYKGVDGMMETDNFYNRNHGPWPTHMPHHGKDPSLQHIFTLAPFTFTYGSSDQQALWDKAAPGHRFEMMFSHGCNTVLSLANPAATAEALKKIGFVVVWELFRTELADGFADILLPDTCYLEDAAWQKGMHSTQSCLRMDDWCFHAAAVVDRWEKEGISPKCSRRLLTVSD